MIRVGFTGTRHGMTAVQRAHVDRLLREIKLSREPVDGDYEEIRGHHGCCEGADLEFGQLCREHGFLVEGHPGPDGVPEDQRHLYAVVHESVGHLMRNRLIVANTAGMIACPPTDDPQPRGGTWYTIGHSQKVLRPLTVITPSGLVGYFGIWPWTMRA